jgi:hypothetical protein
MIASQLIFSNQETVYSLGQGKLFLILINPITKLPTDKARCVGNVPEEGFTITPTVQKLQHSESITGKNRQDFAFETGQSLQVTIKLENVDIENLAQAIFGTSVRLLQATVTSEIHAAYKGYSFSLERPDVGDFTIINPSGLIFNQDYRVNFKTGEVFIPENSQIVNESLVTVYYTAPPINRITGYTALNTELWVRYNGVNMAVIDFIKNTMPTTQLELTGEALYEPALETVREYKGGMFKILQIGKSIGNAYSDPFIPNGELIYCRLSGTAVSSFRPVDTVNGDLIYCLFDLANSGFNRSPD